MKANRFLASMVVVVFLGLMSCGKGEQARNEKDPADSLVNDSVPPSGENEFQSDVEPKTELDTAASDTTERNP